MNQKRKIAAMDYLLVLAVIIYECLTTVSATRCGYYAECECPDPFTLYCSGSSPLTVEELKASTPLEHCLLFDGRGRDIGMDFIPNLITYAPRLKKARLEYCDCKYILDYLETAPFEIMHTCFNTTKAPYTHAVTVTTSFPGDLSTVTTAVTPAYPASDTTHAELTTDLSPTSVITDPTTSSVNTSPSMAPITLSPLVPTHGVNVSTTPGHYTHPLTSTHHEGDLTTSTPHGGGHPTLAPVVYYTYNYYYFYLIIPITVSLAGVIIVGCLCRYKKRHGHYPNCSLCDMEEGSGHRLGGRSGTHHGAKRSAEPTVKYEPASPSSASDGKITISTDESARSHASGRGNKDRPMTPASGACYDGRSVPIGDPSPVKSCAKDKLNRVSNPGHDTSTRSVPDDPPSVPKSHDTSTPSVHVPDRDTERGRTSPTSGELSGGSGQDIDDEQQTYVKSRLFSFFRQSLKKKTQKTPSPSKGSTTGGSPSTDKEKSPSPVTHDSDDQGSMSPPSDSHNDGVTTGTNINSQNNLNMRSTGPSRAKWPFLTFFKDMQKKKRSLEKKQTPVSGNDKDPLSPIKEEPVSPGQSPLGEITCETSEDRADKDLLSQIKEEPVSPDQSPHGESACEASEDHTSPDTTVVTADIHGQGATSFINSGARLSVSPPKRQLFKTEAEISPSPCPPNVPSVKDIHGNVHPDQTEEFELREFKEEPDDDTPSPNVTQAGDGTLTDLINFSQSFSEDVIKDEPGDSDIVRSGDGGYDNDDFDLNESGNFPWSNYHTPMSSTPSRPPPPSMAGSPELGDPYGDLDTPTMSSPSRPDLDDSTSSTRPLITPVKQVKQSSIKRRVGYSEIKSDWHLRNPTQQK